MCTVTIVPLGVRGSPGASAAATTGRARIACNRDEQRTRPAGLPPIVRTIGGRRVACPIDPESGGTWIGVNDAGLVFALLNANPRIRGDAALCGVVASAGGGAFVNDAAALGGDGEHAAVTASSRSRGEVIPALGACGELDEVVRAARALDARAMRPFRLVVTDGRRVASLRGADGRVSTDEVFALTAPCLFTSSGLGDALVEGPRRALFVEHFGDAADGPAAQERFHRHRWPDRPHLSVCMSRPDARTVSYTVISLDDDATMDYYPAAPDTPTTPSTVRLSLRRPAAT